VANLTSYDEASQSSLDKGTKAADTSFPAYRYAKTLVDAATGAQKKDFDTNWNTFLGRYNWTSPASSGAKILSDWCFKGVVNWTYSTIKTKAAMILGAPTQVHAEPMDDQSTYYDRLLVKSATEHLLKSVRFDDVRRDAFISGSVTGVGVSMWQYRADSITGAWKLVAVPINTGEFFKDPAADSITSPDCRYVVWSPLMEMSRVREIFLGKSKDVKPDVGTQTPSGVTYTTPNDSNLLYGTGQTIKDPQRNPATQKARVHFVWIKDESLIEEMRDVLISEPEPGYTCTSCGNTYSQDSFEGPADTCPMCDQPLENVTIPPKMRTDRTIRKAYPYGRLIVYSGDVLLFDGQNPCELESVFPFAVYHHDRIPGNFLGVNDVDLLFPLQDAQNRTVGQIIDSTRLTLNGVFVYPISAKSFTDMGVAPGERHPTPDHLTDKPRWVTPTTNIAIAQLALGAIKEQFIIVSGLGGPSLGEVSSPPISATEAEISNARLSDRMKAHGREFATYCSDFAEIGRQLAIQFYGGEEQSISVAMPDSSLKDVTIEWQKLPNVRVRVSVNQSEAIRDKQIGQNITIGMQNGILDSPYAELYLELVGATPSQIKEVMDRKALHQELMGGAPPAPPQAAPPPMGLVQGGMPNEPNS
jgi:hypothetical protein